MIDYQNIKNICGQDSMVAMSVIDGMLINYAAKQNNLAREANQYLAKYKHITRKQDSGWIPLLITQYIAHRIFRKDGLISKYLNHSALKNLTSEERDYLVRISTTPWRFRFSIITANPADDFYEMEDIFSEESFLLYSTGISTLLKAGNRKVWFNLVGFNGHCWQSFGPINGYRSFEPDDIFFFASELAPSTENEDDIIKNIDQNPVPYMMLLCGSEYPMSFHQDQQIVINQTDFNVESFKLKNSRKHFEVESAGNVYQYGLKEWNGFPHFAQLYYDQEANTLSLSSMTDKGFSKLVQILDSEGIKVSAHADIRLNPAMLTTAGEILKKKIELNEYEKLFIKKSSPDEQKELDKLNNLAELMLPDINAGNKINFRKLAEKTGIDVSTIEELAMQIAGTINRDANS